MPRSFEDIQAAKLTAQIGGATQEVQQMPPGYQAGGRVFYKDSNFLVDPFVMNVRGRLVTLDTQQEISGDFWQTVRAPSNWYYLYVSEDRVWSVWPTAPEFDSTLFAYQHPITGDRLLGVGYVDANGDMVYASSVLSIDSHEVRIAASDYGGQDYDYICDGTDDEEQINDAYKYLNGAFGGGRIVLTAGTFKVRHVIPRTGVWLQGRGNGTIVRHMPAADAAGAIEVSVAADDLIFSEFKMDDDPSWAAATNAQLVISAAANNVTVRDVTFEMLGGGLGSGEGFLASIQVTNVKIQRCVFINFLDIGVQIGAAGEVEVSDCLFYWSGIVSSTYSVSHIQAIGVSQAEHARIYGNQIRDIKGHVTWTVQMQLIRATAAELVVENNLIEDCEIYSDDTAGSACIVSEGHRVRVANNTIRRCHAWEGDNSTTGLRGIWVDDVDDCQVHGNRLDHVDIGILVDTSADRTVVSDNHGTNCGQLIDYGNCEDANEPAVLGEAITAPINCSWARSTEQAYEGTYSYKMTMTTGGSDALAYLADGFSTSDMHGLFAGVEYTFEAYVYVPSVGGPAVGEVFIDLYDHVGGWGANNDSPSGTDAWEKVSVTVPVRAAATGILIRFRISNTASSTEYFYVDNIRLYPTKNQNSHGNLFDDTGTGTIVG